MYEPGTESASSIQVIHKSGRARVTRLFLPGHSVILKQPLGPDCERRLAHEVTMLERLRGVTGVAQLLESPRIPGSIVLEDIGGTSLAKMDKPLAVDQLVQLAISLSQAVAEMHRRGVVHRDINPTNILIGRDGRPWLVDFALATSMVEIRPTLVHLSEIMKAPAYVAPEQTGRTGRSVDRRSDLYALGATLYELATGELAFRSRESLQLALHVLAHVPVPPSEVDPKLPTLLSEIIMHLLEKEPDSRYQTAEGLVHDLERLQDVRGQLSVNPVRIGDRGIPQQLPPPPRLVGRDDEVAALRGAFTDALTGGCRGVLIRGAAGVGKTALVDELRPVVTGCEGWFVAGKFDQHRRDLEFDAINQAFRALGGLLLTEPERVVTSVRQRILERVGPNAGLLTAAVPEFAALLGVAPEYGEPLTADVRAQRTVLDVLRAAVSPKRPIVLFLDDLQWAGRTPLGAIDLVLEEEPIQGLLLVGAYRDNEVNTTHSPGGLRSRWRDEAGILHLQLANLTVPTLARMVADILRVDLAAAEELAEIINPHTSGNPHETIELLNALRREHVLSDTIEGWQWNVAAVRERLGNFDTTESPMATVRILTEQPRQTVEAMACLGGRARRSVLQVATAQSASTLERALTPALDEGLIVAEPGAQEMVRFRHDRVREVILNGLDPHRRAALHLAMARRLAEVPELFAVAAEQYLPVIIEVDDPEERRRTVNLLERAAEQASLTGDHARVITLLTGALQLIDPADKAALLVVHAGRHAALYKLGRHEESDNEYRTIVGLGPSAQQRADTIAVQVQSLTHRNRFAEAVALGLATLRDLDISIPTPDRLPIELERKFQLLYRWLDETDSDTDQARPQLDDPRLLAATRVVNALLPASFSVPDITMVGWLSLTALGIWLDHGPGRTLIGPIGVAAYVAVALRGDNVAGYRAARRIVAHGDALGYEPETALARHLSAFAVCWFEPIENGAHQGRRAREVLITGGELAWAGYTFHHSVYYLFDCAPTLDDTGAEVAAGLDFVRRTGNEQTGQRLDGYQWLIDTLRGERNIDPRDMVTSGDFSRNPLALLHAHITRAVAAIIFCDSVSLTGHTAAMLPLLVAAPGLYPTAVARLLRGLALAGQARSAEAGDRPALLAELEEIIQWLNSRAMDAPDNFAHMLHLLEAERAWAVDDLQSAMVAFDLARRAVAGCQRPWHRALITERTANFFLAYGIEQGGYELLTQARELYLTWGATAKVAQLDWAYPSLRQHTDGTHTGVGNWPSEPPFDRSAFKAGTVDLLSILSSSQALSSETSLDQLRSRVTEVLEAMTGATNVHLALWSEASQTWLLPSSRGLQGTVPISEEDDGRMLPNSVLRYAQRTEEPVVVNDAASDERFAQDPYFADVACCSLMALPILSQGSLQAVVVLENRLIRGAFTTQRLDAVKLVAGQLAVSLSNARLYSQFRRIAEEQSALRRVTTLVAEAAPPAAIFAAVAEEVGHLLDVDVAAVRRFLADGTCEFVGHWNQRGGATSVGLLAQPAKGTVTATVRETGRPARVDHYSDENGEAARAMGIRSAVGVPITVEGDLWGLIAVVSTSDEPPPPDTEERLVNFTELVATAIASAQANEALRSVADEQASLGRVAALVAQGEGPEVVFAAVAEQVGNLLGTDDALVARFEPDDTVTIVASWSTTTEPLPVGLRRQIAPGEGVTPLIRATGLPARVDAQTRYYEDLGVETSVAAPITIEGRMWGLVGVALRGATPAPAETENRLAAFTGLVATAIANAESRTALLASRARIVAAADETRRRIERDLHDGAQQRLVSLALQLRKIQGKLPPDVAVQLDAFAVGVSDALDELGELARGIHPPILTERGLGPALNALARRSDVPVEINLCTEERPPYQIEVAAYFFVSEALTNVTKHAHATSIVVTVTADTKDRVWHIEVQDDGVGGADYSHGTGLVGLRDRVEALNGQVEIESADGAGTTLRAQIPLPHRGDGITTG